MSQNSALVEDVALPDLEAYRLQARGWLADNMTRRVGPPEHHEVEYYTPEVMAAGRALQRRVYEAGYAGISFPKAYGGQGLPGQYEAVFVEEAKDYAALRRWARRFYPADSFGDGHHTDE